MSTSESNYFKRKRFWDIIVSTVLFFILSPLLIVIAALVKLTTPGPAFFKWRVAGQNGQYFTSYKFRSMYKDANKLKAALLPYNEMIGPVFKLTNDPRVTQLGIILRKFSLDELPQLWSVINGDMSLVGPRPPLQSEYEYFTEWQKQKLAVKPGITCIWQAWGRNEINNFNEWVQMDLDYIQNRDMDLDLSILLATLKSVYKGTGK